MPHPDGILAEAVVRSPEAKSLQYGRMPSHGVVKPRSMASALRRRSFTDEEVIGYIGKEESATLNFTTMMIEGIAMQEISEWIDRCKARKMKEYRTYTKPMEEAMHRYLATVEAYWADRMDVYGHYFNLALKESKSQREIYLHLGMDNEICRQLPADRDREAALQLCFTVEMLRQAEDVDRVKMERLSEASGLKVCRNPDPNVRAMIAACRRMQSALGIEVEVTPAITSVTGAFRNRMTALCRRLLKEEKEAVGR